MAKPIANPPVTMTAEALKQVIAAAIREHDAAKAEQAKSDTSADMDRLCTKAFTKAGYKDIQPRTNVLTYNKWLEQGFRVKEGEKSVRVKNLRLFHRSQVEAMSAKDKAEAISALAAKREARTADKLPKPSPVQTPVAARSKAGKVIITEHGNA